MLRKVKLSPKYSFIDDLLFPNSLVEQFTLAAKNSIHNRFKDGVNLYSYSDQKQVLRCLALHFEDYASMYANVYRYYSRLISLQEKEKELKKREKRLKDIPEATFIDPLEICEAKYAAIKYNGELSRYKELLKNRQEALDFLQTKILDASGDILADLTATSLQIKEDISTLNSYIQECYQLDSSVYDDNLSAVTEHNLAAFRFLEKQRVDLDLQEIRSEKKLVLGNLSDFVGLVDHFYIQNEHIHIDIDGPICQEGNYEISFFEAALRKTYLYTVDAFDQSQVEQLSNLSDKYNVEFRLIQIGKSFSRER